MISSLDLVISNSEFSVLSYLYNLSIRNQAGSFNCRRRWRRVLKIYMEL